MTEDSSDEKPKLPSPISESRRNFLRYTGAFTAGALLGLMKAKPAEAQTAPPSSKTTAPVVQEQSSSPETLIQKEIIDGVEVYGTKVQLDSRQQLDVLNNYFDSNFFQKVSAKSRELNITQPTETSKMLEFLDPNTRFLQTYITRSLYRKFQFEAQAGGLDFVTWLNTHIKVANSMIESNSPKVDLKAKLSRVIVVSDGFSPNNPKPNPEQSLPRYPVDIDNQWEVWKDYRVLEEDPKTREWSSSAWLYPYLLNGKEVILDYGLIHEWSHGLFNYLDEYVQNVESVSGFPNFYLNKSEGVYAMTPWANYCLKRIQDLKIRGYYTDPRGGGNGYNGKPDSAIAIWAEVPASTSFGFVDQDSKPIDGSVELFKVKTAGDYYAKKSFSLQNETVLDQGQLALSQDLFTPQRNPNGDVIFPTNWFMKITTGEEENYYLHIPASGFNISKLSGIDSVQYQVKFYQPPSQTPPAKQIMDMVDESNISSYLNTVSPYASMKIEGSAITFFWSTNPKDELSYSKPTVVKAS